MAAAPVSLPKLPGLVYDMPQASKRGQTLRYINGYAVLVETPLAGGASAAPAPPPLPVTVPTVAAAIESLSVQPRWLSHDKKVLRFNGYIEEAVAQGVNHFSSGEMLRVRKLDLLYYLVDDTVEVLEPRVENSGIAQGSFLKRVSTALRHMDLRVGGEPVPIFGRALFLVGCDEWTRAFFAESGAPQPPNTEVPGSSAEATARAAAVRKQSDAVTRGMQFLAHDGKVLAFSGRFTALANAADEGHPLGTNTLAVTEAARAREVNVFFYLADNTVEIKEPGIGLIMRRQRVPLQAQAMGVSALGGPDPSASYLTAAGMRVGATLRIFSREYTLTDADPYTRQVYAQELGITQPAALPAPAGQVEKPKAGLPPHNGYGSAVDSARNCNTLTPKVSIKDSRAQTTAFHALNGLALRFTATMVNAEGTKPLHETDTGRAFVLTHFLEDDTVSVFEPQTRERPASRYLERTVVPKPAGGRLVAADVFVGAMPILFGRCFRITGADAWSETYMAQHAETWGSGIITE